MIAVTANQWKYFVMALCYVALSVVAISSAATENMFMLWPSASMALVGCILLGKSFFSVIFMVNILAKVLTIYWDGMNPSLNLYAYHVINVALMTVQVIALYSALRKVSINILKPNLSIDIFLFLIFTLIVCMMTQAGFFLVDTFYTDADIVNISSGKQYILLCLGQYLGLILFTPLLLIVFTSFDQLLRGKSRASHLVVQLIVVLMVLVNLQSYIESNDYVKVHDEFKLKATVVENSLKTLIINYLNILEKAEIKISTREDEISSSEFAELAELLMLNSPAIKALSWNPVIRQSELSHFVIKTQQELGDGFTVKGQPLTRSDPMVVVKYIAPFASNQAAQGFNVFSNPVRKAALLLAEKTRSAVASHSIQLVQSKKKESGFLIFNPSFSYSKAKSSQFNEAAHINGFVVGVFVVDNIIDEVFHHTSIDFMSILLEEENSKNNEHNSIQNTVFYGDKTQYYHHVKSGKYTYDFPLDFAQQRWNISLYLDESEVLAFLIDKSLPAQVALTFICSLMLYLLLTNFSRQESLEKQVAKRTCQLSSLNDKLKHAAYHDALTGIENRRMFTKKLKHAINIAKRNKSQIAILYIDLNRFKYINDTYGHNYGDKLLIEMTKRFNMNIRESDTLARIGGDEFIIMLEQVNVIDNASVVAKKLLNSIEKPINIEEKVLQASISIGISFYPFDGKNFQTLLQCADTAMYYAKKNAIGVSCFSHHFSRHS